MSYGFRLNLKALSKGDSSVLHVGWGKNQQADEGGRCSWLVLINRTIQLCRAPDKDFTVCADSWGSKLPSLPTFFLFSHHWHFNGFESFLTQCKWFSLCFGVPSDTRRGEGGLEERKQEAWGGWNNVESVTKQQQEQGQPPFPVSPLTLGK